MRAAGIDPGLKGAIAIVDDWDDEPQLITDMPVADGWVSLAGLPMHVRQQLATVDLVVVEAVHSMPRQGVASTFKFGHAFGVAVSIADISAGRVELVRPQRWLKHFDLIGGTKDDHRGLAQHRWPSAADKLKRKKDDGRADALLLAAYGLECCRAGD